ncbi:hypothetical protein OG866_18715 [Streptomyces sp. NBC_00663]|uniref:hypothetical protein n=1 Tax=Streptomyces sp. NBC_00663 TaxID=2975801 RepID=UPI002E3173C5|nr:hypothetical protein [Streptomyces sp. NBC_00663]
MRNRSWIVAAVATAGVVVGAALYIDASENGHADVEVEATVPPSPPAEDWCVGTRAASLGGDTPLERTLGRIDKLAAGEYADVYTGMGVDEDANAADVWRIPGHDFDTAVCDAAEEGVKLRLHPADVDRRTLDALAERIGEDMRRWDGTFQLREVGVDERGFVRVGVDDPGTAAPLVEKAFGARYIRVEYVDQAYAAED